MDARRKRLLFRCRHCGMQENDILLGAFAERHIASLGEDQLAQLEALLGESDSDIYDWISGRRPLPARLTGDVIGLIQNFKKQA